MTGDLDLDGFWKSGILGTNASRESLIIVINRINSKANLHEELQERPHF